MSPKTSRGSTSRCSSDRSRSTPPGCTCCRGRCNWKTPHLITPDDLQRVIGLLKATFTHLILDLSKGYTAIDMVALEMATQVLLVTQLDLPCLRNVVRLMMSFGEMERLERQGEDRRQSRRPG